MPDTDHLRHNYACNEQGGVCKDNETGTYPHIPDIFCQRKGTVEENQIEGLEVGADLTL